MDPITLVPLALSFILPYAKKLAGKLAERSLEAVPDVVGKIWDTVKDKLEERPDTSALPADLVATPDDQDVQGAYKYQLKKLLENDAAFAKQLEELVNQANVHVEKKYSATMNGDGAIAQGDGAVAVGKGGNYFGGNVSGSNIVTGNNNLIGNDKKKK
jgi:hypothetical protein